jgi:hypothetical protein
MRLPNPTTVRHKRLTTGVDLRLKAAVVQGSVSGGTGRACPRNDGGKVVRYGFRKRIDNLYARPRYRCSPPGGKAPTSPLPSKRALTRIPLVCGVASATVSARCAMARRSGEVDHDAGRPRLDWTAHNNRAGQKGLFELSERAQSYVENEKRGYWSAAQAGTVQRKVAVINAYHAAHGFPPVELTNAKTPAIKTTNKTVVDFPLIARECDPANPDDPEHTAAGGGNEVGWICFSDPRHRWRAQVGQRCGRASGCPECGRVRGLAIREQQPDLATIRARWGDYEDLAPIALSEPEENAIADVNASLQVT